MNQKFKFFYSYKVLIIVIAFLALGTAASFFYWGVNSPAVVLPVFIVLLAGSIFSRMFGSWIEVGADKITFSVGLQKSEVRFSDISSVKLVEKSLINYEYKNYQESEYYKEAEVEYEKNINDENTPFSEASHSGHRELDSAFVKYDTGASDLYVVLTLKSGMMHSISPVDANGFYTAVNACIS